MGLMRNIKYTDTKGCDVLPYVELQARGTVLSGSAY
ncbi:hypothetical protein PI124_g6070 [Phytophthora idaei]|nr:hypothetical protein PI125_g17456 [Phytophthora idaei]KAG3249300.1 hypothetical protein PI124_g6070 [Phytophthora idaei]